MRQELQFGGLFNSQAENRVPPNAAWAMQNATTENGILEGGPRYSLFWDRASYSSSDVGYGLGYGKHSSNEVQKLKITAGTPTSGNVKLTWGGQETANIAYNADAATVQNALELLSNILTGDVTCYGGPWPGQPIFVKFQGQYANADQSAITLTSNTMNNSATVTISEFIKGGTTECYLSAIKENGESTVTIYKVDMDGTETEIATGLNASAWFFEQMGDRIFAVNATNGVHYYRLGGSWDDIGSTSRPARPEHVGGTSYQQLPFRLVFTAAGLNATITATGVTETASSTAAGGFQLLNAGANITTPTEIAVTVDFASAQDWQFSDYYRLNMGWQLASVDLEPGSVQFQLINAGATTLDPSSSQLQSLATNSMNLNTQWAGVARTSRDDIDKLLITFTVSKWNQNSIIVFDVYRGMTWMCNSLPISADPATQLRQKIEYAYSYYDVDNDVESLLSDSRVTPIELPRTEYGTWVTVLTLMGNPALDASDRIYVYRREKSTGLWRRLPTDANNLTTFGAANVTSGSTSFQDRWMEHELTDFPTPTALDFPGAHDTISGLVIGVWKNCLVLGSGKKLWLSFVRQPDLFAPDPDNQAMVKAFADREDDNPDQGRTYYLSDNKAEEVYGIAGQDSLYGITPESSYAVVGDTPIDSSPPRRLPGSRGAVSTRGTYRYGGGLHVASQDGLWYYSVGRGFSGEDNGALVEREETLECRRSWQTTLLGSSYSGLAMIEHDDRFWIFNGTKYLSRTRNGQWIEGTFTDSVVAAAASRSRGLRFQDSTGRIHTISTSTTTDNGTTVTWTYETGILDGPRARVTDFEIQAIGTPTIKVRTYSSMGTLTDSDGRKYDEETFDTGTALNTHRLPCVLMPAHRHKFIFQGQVGRDKLENLAVIVEGSGKAYGT